MASVIKKKVGDDRMLKFAEAMKRGAMKHEQLIAEKRDSNMELLNEHVKVATFREDWTRPSD